MSDPDRLRAIQERVDKWYGKEPPCDSFDGVWDENYDLVCSRCGYKEPEHFIPSLLSLVSELTQEREKALAAQCDHEKCIAEVQAGFDLTLDQALTRAEQAEAQRDESYAAYRKLVDAMKRQVDTGLAALEEQIKRAEHAEADRDALARTLEQIRQNVSDDIWELITAKGGGVTG